MGVGTSCRIENALHPLDLALRTVTTWAIGVSRTRPVERTRVIRAQHDHFVALVNKFVLWECFGFFRLSQRIEDLTEFLPAPP